jgi:hypothetical protein
MKNMKAMLALVLALSLSLGGGVAFASDGIMENGADRGPSVYLNFVDGPSVSTGHGTKDIDFSPVTYEGTTADAYETTVDVTDPTADRTILWPDQSGTALLSTAAQTAANSITGVANGFEFEGATANAFETTVSVTDPTADRAVVIPDQGGTVHLSSGVTALTPGTTVTLTVKPGHAIFTDTITTDNQDQTINASGAGSAGDRMTIIFTTDTGGSGDEVITFGTNMLSTGTLTLANLTADVYVVNFASNGTTWVETGRTAVQTT